MQYDTERKSIIRAFPGFSFARAEALRLVPKHTSRGLNREFEDKLDSTVINRCLFMLFLPDPFSTVLTGFRSLKYIKEGMRAMLDGKLSVAGIIHLFIRYRDVLWILRFDRHLAVSAKHAVQPGHGASIFSLPQLHPEHDKSRTWVAAAHIPDQL